MKSVKKVSKEPKLHLNNLIGKKKPKAKKKVEKNDWQCPECQSDQIIGEDIMVEGGQASQECHCSDCEARWYNVYKFSHSEKIA